MLVASDMLVNGVPMSASELHSQRSPDEVARFYKVSWEARRLKVLETNESGWRTIATKDGNCFYTVQIRPAPGQGTYALLGLTELGVNPTRALGEGFPKMSGSTVHNDLLNKDSGKVGRTLLLTNSYPPSRNAEFYRETLSASGWVAVSEQSTRAGSDIQAVQTWRRGVEEANLVIARVPNATQVVVNMVSRP